MTQTLLRKGEKEQRKEEAEGENKYSDGNEYWSNMGRT
jgi:hypothetical protein